MRITFKSIVVIFLTHLFSHPVYATGCPFEMSASKQFELLNSLHQQNRPHDGNFPELRPFFEENVVALQKVVDTDIELSSQQKIEFKGIVDRGFQVFDQGKVSITFYSLLHLMIALSIETVDLGEYLQKNLSQEEKDQLKSALIQSFYKNQEPEYFIETELGILTQHTMGSMNILAVTHAGFYCVPIVMQDGIIPIKLLNCFFAHGIFPMGIPLSKRCNFDGNLNVGRFYFIWHDLFHMYLHEICSSPNHQAALLRNPNLNQFKKIIYTKIQHTSYFRRHLQKYQQIMKAAYDILSKETDPSLIEINDILFHILYHEPRRDFIDWYSPKCAASFGSKYFCKGIARATRPSSPVYNDAIVMYQLIGAEKNGIPLFKEKKKINRWEINRYFLVLYNAFLERYPAIRTISYQLDKTTVPSPGG